jgi:hypothetical protein
MGFVYSGVLAYDEDEDDYEMDIKIMKMVKKHANKEKANEAKREG